jgi:hypothetical protein
MELISKLPEDIINRIIPYTYNIQNKELLADIIHYNNSLTRIIKIYKRSIWCPLPEYFYIETQTPYKSGLLFDLCTYTYLNGEMFIGDVNIWDRSIAFNKFKDYKNKNHFDSTYKMRKIKIIWGLMTIQERKNFIKIRKNENDFIVR